MAINEANQVVGVSEVIAGGSLTPTLWEVDLDGNAVGAPATLEPLVAGGFAAGQDINDSGVVVGSAANAAGSLRAVAWADPLAAPATLQSLTPAGFSAAYAINNDGRIVGEAENSGGLFQAVYWQRSAGGAITGPFVLPGTPAGWEAGAYAVNSGNMIAGELIDAAGISHAALWQWDAASSTYTRVDLATIAGFAHAVALGLNDPAAGEDLAVVGEVIDDGLGGETHAVRWSVGATVTVTDLGTANRTSSAAAVNAAGTAAGFEENATGTSLASVWSAAGANTGLFTTASQAFDINGNNLVVGRNGSAGFVKRVN